MTSPTPSSDAPAPYEIRLGSSARRGLWRIPGRLNHAVIRYIAGPLAQNPHRVGKPLRGDFTGFHAARVGLFRIIYRIDEQQHAVRVERIDHRADAYRTVR